MPISTKIFRVFVSSTFSDLIAERDALQSKVYQRLAALCKAHGASFQAVDLRWGVSEQAAEDQRTMRICLGEIDRCRELTPYPNFILLMGDRYGWQPIPELIPANEFEKIRTHLSQQRSQTEELQLLERWYVRDDNALPPVYELQSRKERRITYTQWLSIEKNLGLLLRQASKALDFSQTQLRRYQASATEQEIAHRGLLNNNCDDDSAFFFFREIEGLPDDDRARQFRDIDSRGEIDTAAQASLARLKADLRNNFPANTFTYRTCWEDTGPSNKHLDKLCNDVYRQLASAILNAHSGEEDETQLDAELRAHALFAKQRSRIFVGRKDTLEGIDRYLGVPAKYPLVIHGPSGSGKSTVISRALQSTGACQLADPIYRFIGTVAGSSNIRLLLASLCSQLRRRCKNFDDPPNEYSDLVRDFWDQLCACAAISPVLIIIDALDQLHELYDAHGLAWLPFELPENVHFIVSCLPGDCLNRLQAKLPPSQLLGLDSMAAEDADELLDLWLGEAGRRLQSEQRQTVIGAFRDNGLPLYLRLLFEQARTWRSNFKPIKPAADIPGLIRETFAVLSAAGRHGRVLVERSLAYIAAGRAGLSHEEVIDVLSRDHQVMADFRRRSPLSPPTDRLPVIIWSRLYLDLAPYLTESLADGAQILDFFHRQLREVVERDYLCPGKREESHRALSEYFAGQQLFVEAEGRRSANLRKLTEWPFQLWGAKDWRLLSQTLSDFRFLNAKVSALGTETVIEDFDLLDDANDDASSEVDYESLKNLQACLRLASGVLSEDAGQLPAQLHGRLAARQSPLLRSLLKEAIVRTSKPWLRPLSASLVSTGGALLTNYVFDRNVEEVAISSDAANLLIGCDDGSVRIVNIDRGNEIRRLQPHTEEVIAMKPLPGGQCFVSGSRDGNLAVWDDQGKIHTRQRASVRRLWDLDVLPDGNVLVAGGEDEPDEHGYNRGIILLLPLGDAVEKGRLQVNPGSVIFVAISPRGHILLCGTSHGSIQKWDLDDQQLLAETSLHDGGAFKAAFLPDGRRALICSGDQSTGQYNLRLWDIHSWEELHVFRHHRYMLTDIAMSQTGDRALSASYDQTLCLWDLEGYRLIARLAGHRHPVRSVVLEPKGDIAYSASGTSVYRWSLDRATLTDNTQGHSDPVHTVTASRDGQIGISAAGDDIIAVWKLSGPQPVLARRIKNCDARRLCVSSDVKIMFFAGDENTVKRTGIWNGTESTLFDLQDTTATALVSSKNDDVLFVGCRDGSIFAWDICRGAEIWRIADAHIEKISSLALANNGKWLISAGGDFDLRGWHTTDGTRIVEMRNESGAPAVAGACNARVVVAGTHYGRIHVWDKGKPEMLWELAHTEFGQNYSVTAVACSPDGRYILSGGTDEMVHAWDTRTGTRIATYFAEDRSTCAHALAQDLFMVGSRNGAVHFLRLEV